MNITDIDDKIIRRARQNYLMNQYKEADHDLPKISSDHSEALKVSLMHNGNSAGCM